MRRNGGGGRAEEVEEEENEEEEELDLALFLLLYWFYCCSLVFLHGPVQYSPVQVFLAGSGWLDLHQEHRRHTLFPRFSSLLQKGFVA